MKLSNDHFRCQGQWCKIKQTCARFQAIKLDKGQPVSMVNNMLDYMGNCTFYIPLKDAGLKD